MKDFLPKVITWFRLDEHVRRLKNFVDSINIRVETLETAPIGDSRLYKVYTALLTQSGTDAPVATVLENTLGDIVWSRTNTGDYLATLGGIFIENKTYISTEGYNSVIGRIVSFEHNDENSIRFISESEILVGDINTPESQDDLLFYTPIEIKVYN